MIDDTTTFRSKERVLQDLSAALQFSPESLSANRQGRVSIQQVKNLGGRCVQPATLALFLGVGPFLIWSWITAGRQQIPFAAAFPVLFSQLLHAKDLFEAYGKIGGGIMLASILIGLGGAAFMASRVSLPLYFDLLDRKVEVSEGRVVAREEQVLRPNGRDPIEKYFFTLRRLKMEVNLAAYRALEDGSTYLLYVLPRSEVLLAIEPKMDDVVAELTPPNSPKA